MSADLDVRCAHVLPLNPAEWPLCGRCGRNLEADDERLAVAWDRLHTAEVELEATRSDPYGRVSYDCCDGCCCHSRSFRGESPCSRCVDVLDSVAVDARREIDLLIADGAR